MVESVSVSAAVRAAFTFLPQAWRRAWGALLFVAVLLCLLGLYGRAGPQAGRLALSVALIFAGVMARGALFRAALARLGPARSDLSGGPGGLQWTFTEWRLLAATLLVGALVVLVAALLVVILMSILFGLASAGKGFVLPQPATWVPALGLRAKVILALAAALCSAFVVWLIVRLSLALPATVDRRRVQVLSVWPLTRARVLSILAGLVVISLPALLVLGLAALVGEALDAARRGQVLRLSYGLTALFIQLPLGVGLTTYFYDRLAVDRSNADSAA